MPPDAGPTSGDAGTQATEAGRVATPAKRKTTAAKRGKAAPAEKPTLRAGTKQAKMIEMLKRPKGATVEQIAAANLERLERVAEVLKVERRWLLHGLGEVEGDSLIIEDPEQTLVAIPAVAVSASMGGGSVVDEEQEGKPRSLSASERDRARGPRPAWWFT